jgi:hypothetical protein
MQLAVVLKQGFLKSWTRIQEWETYMLFVKHQNSYYLLLDSFWIRLHELSFHTTNIKIGESLSCYRGHMVSLTRQLWMKLTNTIQKKLKVSSTQLLYQSAPYQAAILFATGPFVDRLLTNRSVFAHKYTTPVVVCSEYFMQLQISEKNNFILSLWDLNIPFKKGPSCQLFCGNS